MNRLMKCESDRKICGVCSGVARYLNHSCAPYLGNPLLLWLWYSGVHRCRSDNARRTRLIF